MVGSHQGKLGVGRIAALAVVLVALQPWLACSGQNRSTNDLCGDSTQCADGKCHIGICGEEQAQEEGTPCDGAGECLSFNCRRATCATGDVPNDQRCVHDEECLSGACSLVRNARPLGQALFSLDPLPPDTGWCQPANAPPSTVGPVLADDDPYELARRLAAATQTNPIRRLALLKGVTRIADWGIFEATLPDGTLMETQAINVKGVVAAHPLAEAAHLYCQGKWQDNPARNYTVDYDFVRGVISAGTDPTTNAPLYVWVINGQRQTDSNGAEVIF